VVQSLGGDHGHIHALFSILQSYRHVRGIGHHDPGAFGVVNHLGHGHFTVQRFALAAQLRIAVLFLVLALDFVV